MEDLEDVASDARRAAFRRALWIGSACALGCLLAGKSVDQAMVDGVIVAIGGLVAWATYHLISGRDDALLLVCLNILPIWRWSEDPWLPTLIITSLAMFGVGVVMGLVNRPPAERPPEPDFAWWDAEVDGAR